MHPEPAKGISILNASAAATRGKNYLLAIAINDYAYHAKLKNAVKDVQDLAALLADRYQFQLEEPFTRFLLEQQATERNIRKCLRELCQKLKPEDRVLLVYSGHGHLDPVTKLGYWVPADAEKDDESTYLSNSVVRDNIKAMPCRHVLLISDSCFSGELLVRDASRSTDLGAFLDWETKPSRWVFCSGKGVVSDGEAGKNSPFAAQILRCLQEQTPGEPLDIALLANKVTKNVRFNYKQQAEACPLFGAGHDGGQFIFYPQKNEQAAFEKAKISHDPQVLQDFLDASGNPEHKKIIRQRLREIEAELAWRRVNKNSYADLDEFLDEYPGSIFAAEARQRKADLKAQSDANRQKRLEEEERRKREEAEAERRRSFEPEMVKVDSGTFQMGSNERSEEEPIHLVTVSDFHIGKFPVTVGEYLKFADETKTNYPEWLRPGHYSHVETGTYDWYKKRGYARSAASLPVACISWHDAVAYCEWLSQKTGKKFRLPSEAEWEFAARGGIKSKGFKFSGSNEVDEVAWHGGNSGGKPHPVGQKKANELGIFDLSGNIWEWCQDVWHGNYQDAPKNGITWVSGGEEGHRVIRGGSWGNDIEDCRAACRGGGYGGNQPRYVGFRLAR